MIKLFVTAPELDEILRDIALRHNLAAYRRAGDGYFPCEAGDVLDSPPMQDGTDKIYLVHRDQVDGMVGPIYQATPRLSGWIDIWVGRLQDTSDGRVLTMTTIQAENRKELAFRPGDWLAQCRRRLRRTFGFGVRARNVACGGDATYRDIGYSAEAARLWHDGVRWKQYLTGNVEFQPDRPPA